MTPHLYHIRTSSSPQGGLQKQSRNWLLTGLRKRRCAGTAGGVKAIPSQKAYHNQSPETLSPCYSACSQTRVRRRPVLFLRTERPRIGTTSRPVWNASATGWTSGIEAASNQQLTNPTLSVTQITGEKRADSVARRVAITFNLLERNGAGDGTRTHDVQLGKMTVD
jgi:hypothetical protein